MSNIERFMYLFMGVLWGHFSSSNSPGISAQELDIHICVNKISLYPPTHNLYQGGVYTLCCFFYRNHSSSPQCPMDTYHFSVEFQLVTAVTSLLLHPLRPSSLAFDFQLCQVISSTYRKPGGWYSTIRVSCFDNPSNVGFTKLLLRILSRQTQQVKKGNNIKPGESVNEIK